MKIGLWILRVYYSLAHAHFAGVILDVVQLNSSVYAVGYLT
ncbi:MAG: hypothetical protein QNL21_05895 [Flavobacteriales bacterium]